MTTHGSILVDVLAESIGMDRTLIEKSIRDGMLESGNFSDFDDEVADDLVPRIKQALLDNPQSVIEPFKQGIRMERDSLVKKVSQKNKRLSFKHARGRKKR